MPPQKPQAARGRPRKLTDDAVVDGAIELIATDGFAALSTRSLAERLGIRSSMLYTYFESLDEIAEAALSRMLLPIRVPSLADAAHPIDELVGFFEAHRELLIVYPEAIPARLDSVPWAQMVGMVNSLLSQFMGLGLSASRAAACYEALIGITMASAATARREQQASVNEVELLLEGMDPAEVGALLRLREWANEPADVRFRGTLRELVAWLLPALDRDE